MEGFFSTSPGMPSGNRCILPDCYMLSEHISVTDMSKARTDSARAADVIKNWLRARFVLEFLET